MRSGWAVAARAACIAHVIAMTFATALVILVGDRSWPIAILLLLPLPALAAPALLVTPALLFTGHWRWAFAEGAALAVATVFLLGGTASAPPRPAAAKTFRVMAWNVHFGDAGREAFERELRKISPDLVVFEATNHDAHAALASAFPSFHLERLSSYSVASRFPIRDLSIPWELATRSGPPYARFTVDTPLGAVKVFVVHPVSQRGAFYDTFRHGGLRRAFKVAHALFTEDYERRSAELTAVAAEAEAAGPPVLVLGDFNVAGPSRMLETLFAGFDDSFTERGRGFGYTFPVGHPFLRLDRILGKGVRFVRTGVGGNEASDHRPIYADVAPAP